MSPVADEAERTALRRYGRASQACLWLFAVAVPLLAFLLRIRWAYAASFGLYALGLGAVQRLLLPPAAVARIEAERGGRLALLGGQALGVVGGLACLTLAWWLHGRGGAFLGGR